MKYPIRRERLKFPQHGWEIVCRDLPGFNAKIDSAQSYGSVIYEAELRGFCTALMPYADKLLPVPLASSKQDDEDDFEVPLLMAVKITLYNELVRQGKSLQDLADLCGFQVWKLKRIFFGQEQDVTLDFVSSVAYFLKVEIKFDLTKLEERP